MLKGVFLLVVVLHGLIHLFGFTKAFNLAPVNQLSQSISKTYGAFWLISAMLFIGSAVLFFLKNDFWWLLSAIAILLSQYLIFSNWHDAKFGTLANVIILIASIIGFAGWHFNSIYKNEVQAGLKRNVSMPDTILTETDLQILPEPVQKYLRYTGAVGQPRVRHFKIEFSGQIRKNEQSEWMPFTSEQYNFMDSSKRLFFMKATMKHLPVAGFHRFENGDAFMDIRLFSLFRVQYQTGKEMGIAETVTFFNDMCCMAPATLIDQRIEWLETEGNRVKAAFTNNGIRITAWLYFNDQGQLSNFISNDRFAVSDNDTMKQIPWSTPLKDYKTIDGHQLAGYADVVYNYPEGDLCYGNFRVVHVTYNFK